MASPVTGIPSWDINGVGGQGQIQPGQVSQLIANFQQANPAQQAAIFGNTLNQSALSNSPEFQNLFGGVNGMNQWINANTAGGGYGGGPHTGYQAYANGGTPGQNIVDYSSGTPQFGGQPAAGADTGTVAPNSVQNQQQPGQGTVMPSTLGAAAGGNPGTPGGSTIPYPSGSIPLPAAGAGLNIGQYVNPAAQYAADWANKALQGTYAGAGDLLSGPAMQAITQYNQNMALNNAWNPAVSVAQQQQQAGTNLGEYNQQFAYNQALNNQTIPFNQQMQLAELGMQGAQGQQGVTNLQAILGAQLAQALGQAQGAGTQGGASAISQAISQMVNGYIQQNLLSRIPALNQTPPPQ